MIVQGKTTAALIAAAISLQACGYWFGTSEAPPLPGDRISVLRLDEVLKPDQRLRDLDVLLPRPQINPDWPQSGGTANHSMHHLAAEGDLAVAWVADIGKGSSSSTQLLAQPVIAGGRVFALDVNARVSAISAETGTTLWTVDLESNEDNDGLLGGGIAYFKGRLYVTTGFAQVIALDAGSGEEIWRRGVSGPVRSAPTVRGGRVFSISIDNQLHVFAADDGRDLWSHVGVVETAGLLGGASPAVDAGVVVAPFSSGELVALRAQNGRSVWSDSLAALRRTDPVSSLAHIRGNPVIDRGRVFAISNSGRMVSIDLRTGGRIWERPIGGTQSPWVAGNFIYVLTGNAELVCLSRREGRIRWVAPLQRFENEKNKKTPIIWVGPVLAGDRLIVASSLEEAWSISPYTGKLLGRVKISGPVLIPPAVAGGTVYILTDEAKLIALR